MEEVYTLSDGPFRFWDRERWQHGALGVFKRPARIYGESILFRTGHRELSNEYLAPAGCG